MPITNGNDKVQDFKNNPATKRKKTPVRRNRSPVAVTLWHHQPVNGNDGLPWAGTGRGFRRSSRHSHVTCPKRRCENRVFFSKELQERNQTFFFPGDGGAKKEKGGNAKLTRIKLNPTPQGCGVLFPRNTWGTNFSKQFCLVKHWWFPFLIENLEAGPQEVGVWKVPLCRLAWPTHQLSQVMETCGNSDYERDSNSVSLAGFGYEVIIIYIYICL